MDKLLPSVNSQLLLPESFPAGLSYNVALQTFCGWAAAFDAHMFSSTFALM